MRNWDVEPRRALIEPGHPQLSVVQQCALLSLARASYYYQPRGFRPSTLAAMRLLDEVYTAHPYFGSRRLAEALGDRGHPIGRDQVRRLMRHLGLVAIYPKRHLSLPNQQHRIYPYRLRGLAIARPDQVWCADLTYIRLRHGFAYLMAIMDWYSRYVLSWELSLSLDSDFCVRALRRALEDACPEIFNTDQGSQFTASDFLAVLQAAPLTISMDGRGRVFDNIMIERLWRTVKYEEVFLHDYQTFFDARDQLDRYLRFYNHERRHSSLDHQTPATVYWAGRQRPALTG